VAIEEAAAIACAIERGAPLRRRWRIACAIERGAASRHPWPSAGDAAIVPS